MAKLGLSAWQACKVLMVNEFGHGKLLRLHGGAVNRLKIDFGSTIGVYDLPGFKCDAI